MTNPTVRVHNLETDEVIDREMTDQEYADYLAASEATIARIEAQKAALEG
jgi:hypothetical protein